VDGAFIEESLMDEVDSLMKKLEIKEKDIREMFTRASGPGGQNVNKVSSCVALLHKPTGIQVKCQMHRSQAQNREEAKLLLLKKIETQKEKELRAIQFEIEREKRRKRKRTKKDKEAILAFKRKHSEKKLMRKKATTWEHD
jgi:peptide chain release factor